jgi:hypothetical protein
MTSGLALVYTVSLYLHTPRRQQQFLGNVTAKFNVNGLPTIVSSVISVQRFLLERDKMQGRREMR